MDIASQYFANNVNLKDRKVYLSGEKNSVINSAAAERFIIQMDLLESTATKSKKGSEVTIILNTIGGEFYHALAIYDTIQLFPYPVHIHVRGQAFSAGALILQAATGMRSMSPNSRLMLHYGQEGYADHPKIFRNWAKESARSDEWVKNVFYQKVILKHPRATKDKIDKMLDFDTILNAKEALKYNLIDDITIPKESK